MVWCRTRLIFFPGGFLSVPPVPDLLRRGASPSASMGLREADVFFLRLRRIGWCGSDLHPLRLDLLPLHRLDFFFSVLHSSVPLMTTARWNRSPIPVFFDLVDARVRVYLFILLFYGSTCYCSISGFTCLLPLLLLLVLVHVGFLVYIAGWLCCEWSMMMSNAQGGMFKHAAVLDISF
jgi:hypothetical protein